MNFYSRNENNENVIFMQMIMNRIEMKFFIDENVFCNDINHEIRYVVDVQKFHRFLFCKRVDDNAHAIVNQNKK